MLSKKSKVPEKYVDFAVFYIIFNSLQKKKKTKPFYFCISKYVLGTVSTKPHDGS